MPASRSRLTLYGLLALLAVFLLATYFLFAGGPDHRSIRSLKALWDLGHVAYFALLVFLLADIDWIKRQALLWQWLGLLMFSLAFGTLIEVLQYDTERTPDMADIARDLTGSLLVLAFYPPFLRQVKQLWRTVTRLMVSLLLIFQLQPLMIALTDEAIARYQFPLLSDFSTPFELERWDGAAGMEIINLDATPAGHRLKISLGTEQYSGVGMKYPVADWRGYKTVNLSIFQPDDEPLSITIRIHDAAHEAGADPYRYNDRFNRRYALVKGWNEIQIALAEVASALSARRMDLSRIMDISLFSVALAKPRVIYLDKIYLSAESR